MATEYVTQADMDAFRTETRGEFAQLRGEFAQLRGAFGELRGEFREVRGEMKELRGDMKDLRGELRAEIAGQTRTTIYTCIGSMLGFGGIALVAGQLA